MILSLSMRMNTDRNTIMSRLPMMPRLASARSAAGLTRSPDRSRRPWMAWSTVATRSTWPSPRSVRPRLPLLERLRQVRLDASAGRLDEALERATDAHRDRHHDGRERHEQQAIDDRHHRHPRQDRHVALDPARQRRQDEREQPGHHQDEQDVAEVDDDVGEQPDEHERHGDGAEHQQRVDSAPFGLDEPAEHASSLAPGIARPCSTGWGCPA